MFIPVRGYGIRWKLFHAAFILQVCWRTAANVIERQLVFICDGQVWSIDTTASVQNVELPLRYSRYIFRRRSFGIWQATCTKPVSGRETIPALAFDLELQ